MESPKRELNWPTSCLTFGLGVEKASPTSASPTSRCAGLYRCLRPGISGHWGLTGSEGGARMHWGCEGCMYYLYIYIYIYIHNIYIYNTSVQIYSRPSPGIMVFVGESSHNGRKFQVSELLLFAQIHIYIYIYIYINQPSIHPSIYISIHLSIYLWTFGGCYTHWHLLHWCICDGHFRKQQGLPDAENTHIPCNVVKTIINNPPHHHFHRW